MADADAGAPPSWLHAEPDRITIEVHLQPGARRSAIVGEHGGRLKIALRAPPVDGRANAELLEFLAERLGLARADVRLVSGATQRIKRVAIAWPAARRSELIWRLQQTDV